MPVQGTCIGMDIEELVIGVKKANLSELKELKVKLPVRLLVNLHYVKLTQSRGISEVVNEALTQYFAEKAGARVHATANAGTIPQGVETVIAVAPSAFRA